MKIIIWILFNVIISLFSLICFFTFSKSREAKLKVLDILKDGHLFFYSLTNSSTSLYSMLSGNYCNDLQSNDKKILLLVFTVIVMTFSVSCFTFTFPFKLNKTELSKGYSLLSIGTAIVSIMLAFLGNFSF